MTTSGDTGVWWFHVNGNTYGTWVRGDPRGWRSRHHREHVDGDYKHRPPPGKYARIEANSCDLMNRPPVLLSPPQREIAGRAMVDLLVDAGIQLLSLCVTDAHYHLLGKFPRSRVRAIVGRAKKHSSFVLREHGIVGGSWAVRCRAVPIEDQAHHENVYRYILDHKKEGGWTWSFREGRYWPTTTGDAQLS
ncbi:MAG: hypothetical protein PHU85_07525 [Phycisphaerae bacterium]|nr:hypothetical protein [Phycisphaerae bacterium]